MDKYAAPPSHARQPPHGVQGPRSPRPVRPRVLLMSFIRCLFALAVGSALAMYAYDLLP